MMAQQLGCVSLQLDEHHSFLPLLLVVASLLPFSLITFSSSAQELFPKKELYHVWILAGEKLDAGLNQKLEARIVKVGVQIGLRLW